MAANRGTTATTNLTLSYQTHCCCKVTTETYVTSTGAVKSPSDIPYTQLTHNANNNKPTHHCFSSPPPTPRSPTTLDSAVLQHPSKPYNKTKQIPPPNILSATYNHQF
eukprot:11162512-Ditylum_brightwellii.AAC.1